MRKDLSLERQVGFRMSEVEFLRWREMIINYLEIYGAHIQVNLIDAIARYNEKHEALKEIDKMVKSGELVRSPCDWVYLAR